MNELKVSQIKNNLSAVVDIFICCASFEERCLSIATEVVDSKIKQSLVCWNSDQDGKILENKNQLMKLLPNSKEILLHSNDPVFLTNNITTTLLEYKDRQDLHVLLDTTTFTHEALLILLRLIRTICPQAKVVVAYVGAQCYSFNVDKPEDKWLTKGVQDVRTIIGYPGHFDFTKRTHLIILFGFEVERTVKMIETFEPDEISIGLGTEDYSINSEHYKINIERHKKIKELYPIKTFEISLRNPHVTRDQILEQLKLFPEHNKIISPLNTKLSTIGAALAYEVDNDIQICYAKGNIYNKDGYAKKSDQLFIYQI